MSNLLRIQLTNDQFTDAQVSKFSKLKHLSVYPPKKVLPELTGKIINSISKIRYINYNWYIMNTENTKFKNIITNVTFHHFFENNYFSGNA